LGEACKILADLFETAEDGGEEGIDVKGSAKPGFGFHEFVVTHLAAGWLVRQRGGIPAWIAEGRAYDGSRQDNWSSPQADKGGIL
jgi:hypothetical protein